MTRETLRVPWSWSNYAVIVATDLHKKFKYDLKFLKELKKWNELLIDDFLYYRKNVAFKKQIAP